MLMGRGMRGAVRVVSPGSFEWAMGRTRFIRGGRRSRWRCGRNFLDLRGLACFTRLEFCGLGQRGMRGFGAPQQPWRDVVLRSKSWMVGSWQRDIRRLG